MTDALWLNLPVSDLPRSIASFTAIGFAPNPGPGNSAQSASFTIGAKKTVLMLFTQKLFATFANSPVADTSSACEVLFSLGAESPEQVDAMAAKAVAAGGHLFSAPAQKNGFMYGCGFSDPDGHRWNVLFMGGQKPPAP